MDRSMGLGGTDAHRIMNGDWHNLYLEKIGEKPADDLSGVFRVQLGVHTEPFHRKWLEGLIGDTINEPEEATLRTVGETPLFGHFDGVTAVGQELVELKHSNSDANARDKALYYAPQLGHYMFVGDFKQAIFSVIPGNNDPDWLVVEINHDYIAQLLELEQQFWWHVTEKVAPEIIPTGKIKAARKTVERTKLNGMNKIDMVGNNQWAEAVGTYVETIDAAKRHEESKATIKAVMPDDAYEAYGYGLVAKRDKRGAVRLSINQP